MVRRRLTQGERALPGIVLLAATLIVVITLRGASRVNTPSASASVQAQIFPTSPRIHLPLALAKARPIHATGAPPLPTRTAFPTASVTHTPTVTPAITPTDSATAAPTVDATAMPTATESIHVLLPDETFEDFPFDPITIVEAAVHGDAIDLRVRYGGGCETHDIRLIAGREFMESYPMQADVRLSHDGHGDMCRALIYEDLRFNLVPLKLHYKGEADTPGPLLLRVRGFAELLRYDFP